jgi:Flp pilus assembly protein TadG
MKWRCARGSQVVEFALILPVLLILVFGIIDFGMAIFDKGVITNSSREGARAGVMYRYPQPTAAQVETFVRDAVNRYCASSLITFGGVTTPSTVVRFSDGTNPGSDISVTVTYRYSYLVISNFLGVAPMTLSSTVVMRKE